MAGNPTSVIAEVERAWYAVYTRSRFEKKVHHHLCSQEIESFLPLYSQRRRWSDRTVEINVPLFPSYLFVHVDIRSDQWFHIQDTRGVVSILGNGRMPMPIPGDQVATIKCVLSAKISVASVPWLQEGKRVCIVAGPLNGMEGVIEGNGRQGRLFIAIKSLGQSIIAEVDARDLRAVY